jgi:methionine-S-sulfoxide reductase
MFGLAVDWPIEWTELEKFYCEAERRLGVSGEPSPHAEDRRSQPYPMPPMVMTHNLKELKSWAETSGMPFQTTPQAKNTQPYDGRAQCIRCNTCSICPTGARYSPDFTFKRLLAARNFELHDRTLVRKLVLHDTRPTIVAAESADVEYRAPVFVLASGYCWSPHLLLLSRNSRFPNGLANRLGLVGRYMCGHAFHSAFIEIDAKSPVKIIYDPSKISYRKLLEVHFATHDPTSLNRQGNDSGTQYRSAIFYANDEQKKIAQDYIAELTQKHAFGKPIVTTLEPLKGFYPAETYHQNYVCNNPHQGYVQFVAMPKVEKVREKFADSLKEKSPIDR